ncbi:MAG: MFS transporter [Mycobacteriales bacterium]
MAKVGDRRWWAVGALALALLVVGLDATVLNLALPTLSTDLHASTTDLQWIVDAYTLAMAAMLLPGGLLGDRYGRRIFLVISLVVLGASSLWCAYTTSPGQLIAARVVLGLGAAFVLPLSLSVLPVLFSEEERGRAVIVLVGMTVVAYPLGPLLGGWLLTHYWWGSVFLINVPVSALAVVAVAVLLPESRSERRPDLDMTGILGSSVALAALTYGAIEAGQKGWSNLGSVLPMLFGAVVLAGFVEWERRLGRRPDGQPLVDLRLFRSRTFSWGTLLATLVSFAMFGLLFAVPQYFQGVRGTDAMGAGIRLLPMIAGLVVGGAVADRLTAGVGAKMTIAAGFALMAAGLFAGATTGFHSGEGFTAGWVALLGAGLGLALPGSMNAALAVLSAEGSGVGSALITAIRTVGGTFGVALLGSVINSGYRGRLNLTGLPAPAADAARRSVLSGTAVARKLHSPALLHSVRSAFIHGMDVMLVACGLIAVAGMVLALLFVPRGPSQREKELADPSRQSEMAQGRH